MTTSGFLPALEQHLEVRLGQWWRNWRPVSVEPVKTADPVEAERLADLGPGRARR